MSVRDWSVGEKECVCGCVHVFARCTVTHAQSTSATHTKSVLQNTDRRTTCACEPVRTIFHNEMYSALSALHSTYRALQSPIFCGIRFVFSAALWSLSLCRIRVLYSRTLWSQKEFYIPMNVQKCPTCLCFSLIMASASLTCGVVLNHPPIDPSDTHPLPRKFCDSTSPIIVSASASTISCGGVRVCAYVCICVSECVCVHARIPV